MRSARLAVVLDVGCVLGFVIIGRESHGEGLAGIASTAWPVLAGLAGGAGRAPATGRGGGGRGGAGAGGAGAGRAAAGRGGARGAPPYIRRAQPGRVENARTATGGRPSFSPRLPSGTGGWKVSRSACFASSHAYSRGRICS